MNITLAIFCIIAVLVQCNPASARLTQPMPSPVENQITSVYNPCELDNTFKNISETVHILGKIAIDSGETSLSLRHSSKSRPYKKIENDWEKIISIANPTLDKLSDFPIALDASPDDSKKKAAISLTTTYQQAIEHLVDYGHYVINAERGENMISQNFSPKDYRPGVQQDRTRANNNNSIRRAFDAYITEAHDALLSLDLPEYRYARICHIASFKPTSNIRKIIDPCELNNDFLKIHAMVKHLGDEASDVTSRALQLRATSRSRPYRKIEQEWSDTVASAKPTTKELTNLSLILDSVNDSPKKKSAQNLIATYIDVIGHFLDYARVGVSYERTESSIGMNGQFRKGLTFGVAKQAPKAAGSGIARQQLNTKFTEADDAFYELKIPERYYAKACGTSFLL